MDVLFFTLFINRDRAFSRSDNRFAKLATELNTYSAKKRLEMQQTGATSTKESSGNRFASSFVSSSGGKRKTSPTAGSGGVVTLIDMAEESRLFRLSQLGFLRPEIIVATTLNACTTTTSTQFILATKLGKTSFLTRISTEDMPVLLELCQMVQQHDDKDHEVMAPCCEDFEDDTDSELFESAQEEILAIQSIYGDAVDNVCILQYVKAASMQMENKTLFQHNDEWESSELAELSDMVCLSIDINAVQWPNELLLAVSRQRSLRGQSLIISEADQVVTVHIMIPKHLRYPEQMPLVLIQCKLLGAAANRKLMHAMFDRKKGDEGPAYKAYQSGACCIHDLVEWIKHDDCILDLAIQVSAKLGNSFTRIRNRMY